MFPFTQGVGGALMTGVTGALVVKGLAAAFGFYCFCVYLYGFFCEKNQDELRGKKN
jgi:hypothetical protein